MSVNWLRQYQSYRTIKGSTVLYSPHLTNKYKNKNYDNLLIRILSCTY